MKIYINSNYEIKSINSCEDASLQEIEVDRAEIFGNKSDFMILNYCYKTIEHGYSIYPAKDYNILEMLDKGIVNKISILNAENIELRKELNQIKTSIASLIATTIEK